MLSVALRAQLGELLIAGFEGHDLPPEVASLIRSKRIGGLILFSRNIRDLRQCFQLLASARALSPELWFTVDQEGGRVQRLGPPFPQLKAPAAFAADDDVAATEAGAIRIAKGLRMLGFHQSYAPVLDVKTNPNNRVLADRSYGSASAPVIRHGLAFIRGLQSQGVAAAAKHFPGHGSATEDSHHELPRVPLSLDALWAEELKPFEAAIQAGVATAMSAHVVYEGIDPDRPATLSKAIATDLLRGELGFEGVLVSDDLEMRAIADHLGMEEAAIQAVAAGCDQLLICSQVERVKSVHEALAAAVESGRLPAARVEEAARRVRALKARYVAPPTLDEDALLAGLEAL